MLSKFQNLKLAQVYAKADPGPDSRFLEAKDSVKDAKDAVKEVKVADTKQEIDLARDKYEAALSSAAEGEELLAVQKLESDFILAQAKAAKCVEISMNPILTEEITTETEDIFDRFIKLSGFQKELPITKGLFQTAKDNITKRLDEARKVLDLDKLKQAWDKVNSTPAKYAVLEKYKGLTIAEDILTAESLNKIQPIGLSEFIEVCEDATKLYDNTIIAIDEACSLAFEEFRSAENPIQPEEILLNYELSKVKSKSIPPLRHQLSVKTMLPYISHVVDSHILINREKQEAYSAVMRYTISFDNKGEPLIISKSQDSE